MATPAPMLPANLDLSALSPAALDELARAIDKERKALHAREIEAVKSKIKKALDESGLSVADLVDLFPAIGRARAVTRPAYRHPSKPALTWTGKGRKPAWVTEFVAGGGNLETLRVK